MPRTGLTCEEFVNLKLRPPASADPAFHSAAETMAAELFPMTLLQASAHLRGRGYDSRPEMLELLVRNKVVNPTRPDAWSQLDVDAAADHFEDCSIYTPYAAMCQTLGCGYADFLRPLREAAEIASAKYRPLWYRATAMASSSKSVANICTLRFFFFCSMYSWMVMARE